MRLPWRRANARPKLRTPEDRMTLTEHLGELRMRIIRSALAVSVGFIIVMAFYAPILDFLKEPYVKACAANPQFECDGGGRILTCNVAAERLFGPHSQLAGRPFSSLLSGAYAESKALAGLREAVNIEVEARTPRGELLPCTASFTPLPERPGRSPGFGVILTGVTVTA